MRSAVTSLIPFYTRVRRNAEIRALRKLIRSANPLNLVIGGAQSSFEGWLTTDRDLLDITSPEDWSRLLEPSSVDRILAEHVFEHLSEDECRIAFAECFKYLQPGGLLRVAVPDGNRHDAAYVSEVTPPKDGHKILFTIQTLKPMLEDTGFKVTPIEFFDTNEQFRSFDWDEKDGLILRSARFDSRTEFKHGAVFYTSLIVDARKT